MLPDDEPMYEDHESSRRYVGRGGSSDKDSYPTILEEEDGAMYDEHEPYPWVAPEGHPSNSEQDDHVMYDKREPYPHVAREEASVRGTYLSISERDDEGVCDQHGSSSLAVDEERQSAQGSYQRSYQSFSGRAGHLEMYKEQEATERSPEMSRSDSEGKCIRFFEAHVTLLTGANFGNAGLDSSTEHMEGGSKPPDDPHIQRSTRVAKSTTVPARNDEGESEVSVPLACRFSILTGRFLDQGGRSRSPLNELSLRVNRELGILICLTCRHALDPNPKSVINHFNANHCAKGETIEKVHPGVSAALRDALDGIPFALPKEVRNQPHHRAPISGIQVRRGFYCPMAGSSGKQCLYTAGATSTVETHIKTKHQGDRSRPRVDDLEGYPCDYQTLFTGNLRQYFQVRTGLTGLEAHPDGHNNPYSAFMKQTNTTSSSDFHPEPIKDDELPSLLRATRWNVFVELYRKNPGDVVALVRYPSARVPPGMDAEEHVFERLLSKLPDVSEEWMDTVYRDWRKSSLYIHRTLARHTM